MQQVLFVFLGGGLGSILRYLIGLKLNQNTLPYGTLTVNVLGSLLIGIVMGYVLKTSQNYLSNNQILFLVVGVFGGFTTLSSFMYENLQFLVNEQYTRFIVYALGTLLLGFLAVTLGFITGKQL